MIQCSVCNNSDKVILEDEPLSLYRCGTCRHVFKNLPTKFEETYDEEYYSEEHKNWFANPDYQLFYFIHNEISKIKSDRPLKVLDVGCGKGDFLKYIKERNPELELYGIDLSSNECPGIKFIKGDILKDNFSMKFDIITNLAVIEHLNSPQLFIKKIKELLLPGGLLFTVTDNDYSMFYRIARLLKKVGMNAAYDRTYMTQHLQCFSRNSLKVLMDMNGLEIIRHKDHNHSIAAVDYPKTNLFTTIFYVIGIYIIFGLSNMINDGILQVAVCRNKMSS